MVMDTEGMAMAMAGNNSAVSSTKSQIIFVHLKLKILRLNKVMFFDFSNCPCRMH